MFIIIILSLAIISILWAFVSLKRLSNNKEIKEVKRELEKGKVIFKN